MFAGTTVFAVLSLAATSAYAQKHDVGDCTLTSLPIATTIAPTVGPGGVATSFASVVFSTFFWDGQQQQPCQPDCGGGRAPIKTNVPGCPGFAGTGTATPLPLPTTVGLGLPNATSTLLTPPIVTSIPPLETSDFTSAPLPTRTIAPATTSADLNPTIPSSGVMMAPKGRDGVFLWLANVVAAAALALHV